MTQFKILLVALLISGSLSAQTFNDALRYSQVDMSGSGRFMGVGASMSSLGADFTSAFTNPAGMAYFRRSEITFTPGFLGASTESTMRTNPTSTSKESNNNFRLANAGLTLASEPRTGKWKTVNFGIGLNRMANYQQEFLYEGRTSGSIVDRFTGLADGLTPNQLDDFEAGLAFDVGAIFGPDLDGFYLNDFQNNPNHSVLKRQLVRYGGYSNELGISLAGNYDEKLMIGATIGIPFYNFNHVKTYEEVDVADEVPIFNNLSYREFLRASGSGFNMKFGIIYAATSKTRIGLSMHTPTFLRISENFSTDLTYNFTENNQTSNLSSASPEGQFDYRVTTPFRVSGGVGSIIGGRGFLSADIEYVDYRSALFRFRSNNIADKQYEQELNNDIRDRLKSTVNMRLGGELAGDNWRLRGGLFLDASPFFNDNSYNIGYSAGAGLREKNFFIDVAYVLRTRNETYAPYLVDNNSQPMVDNKINISQILLTIGFKI